MVLRPVFGVMFPSTHGTPSSGSSFPTLALMLSTCSTVAPPMLLSAYWRKASAGQKSEIPRLVAIGCASFPEAPCPWFFCLRGKTCAHGYPQPRQGESWYGLPVTTQDNTFPVRCIALTVQDRRMRRWYRHNGNNSQEAYIPTDVYLYAFRFYAVPAVDMPS